MPLPDDLASFEAVLADAAVVTSLQAASPALFAAASNFWRAPMEAEGLGPRMKELVLLALHATATALDVDAVERHIRRAQKAGATNEDVLDVLITLVGVANHSLYSSVPVLEQELEKAGITSEDATGDSPEYQLIKDGFIAARGFWNPHRDAIARLMPRYFQALNGISTASWQAGSLQPKEREFVCIALVCGVTHSYEVGLRLHIRNALSHGATRGEILEVFQLSALVGLEGFILGSRILFGDGTA